MIPATLLKILRCPSCGSDLLTSEDGLECANTSCLKRHPVVNGVPVLINEANSLFSVRDFLSRGPTTFNAKRYRLKALARKYFPSIGKNLKAGSNFREFVRLLKLKDAHPRILIIGGSILGSGAEPLLDPDLELVETDVSFGPRTGIIADGHDLPFRDSSFQGVVVQAVLEHVMDPHRVVQEIYRVLDHEGIVYAETPFMQQVHMPPYDFTRFTHLGHRRLFRHFREISSGAALGTGSALAWAWMYFLLSFSSRPAIRLFLMGFAHLTAFWLKYFDHLTILTKGSMDGACGFYFFYRKADNLTDDKEIMQEFKGIR